MQLIIEEKTPVYLSPDEAMLFMTFQKNYQVIARILGSMEALKVNDLSNGTLTMDFDSGGVIQHSSITKHYRK